MTDDEIKKIEGIIDGMNALAESLRTPPASEPARSKYLEDTRRAIEANREKLRELLKK